MAEDLKLRLKVTLKGGDDVFPAGKHFTGTLDEFPKMIQTEYLAENWDVIEVLVDAKGREVPKKPQKPVTNSESTGIVPTSDKKPVDGSEGPAGRVRTDVSTVESTTVADSKAKDAADSKGESGTDDSDASSDAAQAKSAKAAAKASPKAKAKPKAAPKSRLAKKKT
jgi:hypothetical protein